MSKQKLPEPETKTAWLQSQGYGPGAPVFTQHTYSRTIECNIPGEGPAYELLFKCSETGQERRWGIIDIIEAN